MNNIFICTYKTFDLHKFIPFKFKKKFATIIKQQNFNFLCLFTDAPSDNVCSIKRKSTGGDVTDDAAKDVVSPKKAKIDEEAPAAKVGANGQA